MEYAQLIDASTVWIIDNALNVLVAAAVLAAGLFLSGLVGRHAADFLPRTRAFDQTIAPLLTQVVRYAILIITGIIVLSQFGVNTTSILAVLGAAGLAIALALQGTLSNMAAGIMMIWLRPFNVGEYIDAEGITGTVVEIGLFGTRLRTYDGIFVFAPNSKIWASKVVNYTRERTRMVETKVRISYGADIAEARTALLSITEDARVLADPAPIVFVDSLNDSAIVLCLRCWVPGSDWWRASVDLREAAKLALDRAQVEIPFNQLDLYVRDLPKPPAEAA